MDPSTSHFQPLIFRAGAAATGVDAALRQLVLDCRMPWLDGPQVQMLGHGVTLDQRDEQEWVLQGGEQQAGVLVSRGGASLEDQTYHLYRRMFALTRGLNRYRHWNYVPRINGVVAGVENYLAFNSGRYRAFAEQFGAISLQDLSAASAVGTQGGALALAFIAGAAPARHFENPRQVPAARYPECYGKDSPLFARGSMILAADGRACWHLSGTASIRGSATVGEDFARQLEVTLENIDGMLKAMAVPARRQSVWKVFLRDSRDLPACRQRLAEVYPAELAQMMFVQADICRRDLLVEIEAIFYPK